MRSTQWAPLLSAAALMMMLAACEQAPVAPEDNPETPETPIPSKPASTTRCDVDVAIRIVDRGAGIHAAIKDSTLHIGGSTAPAECTSGTDASRTLQTASAGRISYTLIVVRYETGTRLYIVRRQTDGTTCIVDLQDTCIASVTELPADFDVDDLPADVPPTLPDSREPEPEPPTTGAPTPGSPGAVGDPEPTPPTKERGSYDYEWTVDVEIVYVVSDDTPPRPVLTADQLAAHRAEWAAEAECYKTWDHGKYIRYSHPEYRRSDMHPADFDSSWKQIWFGDGRLGGSSYRTRSSPKEWWSLSIITGLPDGMSASLSDNGGHPRKIVGTPGIIGEGSFTAKYSRGFSSVQYSRGKWVHRHPCAGKTIAQCPGGFDQPYRHYYVDLYEAYYCHSYTFRDRRSMPTEYSVTKTWAVWPAADSDE